MKSSEKAKQKKRVHSFALEAEMIDRSASPQAKIPVWPQCQ